MKFSFRFFTLVMLYKTLSISIITYNKEERENCLNTVNERLSHIHLSDTH